MEIKLVENVVLEKEESYHYKQSNESYPYLHQVIAFFDGILSCSISTQTEFWESDLFSCLPYAILINGKADKCHIKIKPQKKTILNYFYLIYESWPRQPFDLKQIDVKKTKITHHPEQDVIIMFDFTAAINEILQNAIPQLEVQILNPDNTLYTVSDECPISNFFWRGLKLYCKITVGERRLRIRVCPYQKWSHWMPFKCMSKKQFRRQKKYL